MKLTRALWPIMGLIFALCAQPGLPLQLQPLKPDTLPSNQLHTRDIDHSNLEIQSIETFLWSGSQHGRTAFANLTVHMPGEAEGILNMERFHSLVDSVNCTRDSVSLQFKNSTAFKHGAKAWAWANQSVNNTFLLVAGAGHCGFNQYRMPFAVSSFVSEAETNTATFIGASMPWKAVAHTYDLHVGGVPPAVAKSGKRDFDKDFTLGFNNPMPFSSWTFPADGFDFTWNCISCGTFGEFIFDFHIHTELDIPVGASLIISPKGLSCLQPANGISIDDFLDFGPAVVFSGGYQIGPLKGSATIQTGVTVSVEDSAKLTIDLLSPDFSPSGWTPHVTEEPVKLTAQISASAQLFLKAAIDFDLSVFDLGFQVGVDLKPYAGVTLSAIDSNTGACKDDPDHHEFGVQLAPAAGVALEADAAWADNTASPFAQVTIVSLTTSLPTACLPFGQAATVTSLATTTPSSSARVSPTSPGSSQPTPPASSPARPPPPPPSSSVIPAPPPSSSSPAPQPATTTTASTTVVTPTPPASSSAAVNHNILHRQRRARGEFHH